MQMPHQVYLELINHKGATSQSLGSSSYGIQTHNFKEYTSHYKEDKKKGQKSNKDLTQEAWEMLANSGKVTNITKVFSSIPHPSQWN